MSQLPLSYRSDANSDIENDDTPVLFPSKVEYNLSPPLLDSPISEDSTPTAPLSPSVESMGSVYRERLIQEIELSSDVSSLEWDHNDTLISLLPQSSSMSDDVFSDAPETPPRELNDTIEPGEILPLDTSQSIDDGDQWEDIETASDDEYIPSPQDSTEREELNEARFLSSSSTRSRRTRSTCSDRSEENFSRESWLRRGRRPLVRSMNDLDTSIIQDVAQCAASRK